MVVTPPTLQVAVVKDGADVVTSNRHRYGRSARTEVNRCGGRCVGVRVGAPTVAQLSATVGSPTLQVAVVKDGTGVESPSRHRNGRSARAEVDRGG